jgi:hypothetical protein
LPLWQYLTGNDGDGSDRSGRSMARLPSIVRLSKEADDIERDRARAREIMIAEAVEWT